MWLSMPGRETAGVDSQANLAICAVTGSASPARLQAIPTIVLPESHRYSALLLLRALKIRLENGEARMPRELLNVPQRQPRIGSRRESRASHAVRRTAADARFLARRSQKAVGVSP